VLCTFLARIRSELVKAFFNGAVFEAVPPALAPVVTPPIDTPVVVPPVVEPPVATPVVGFEFVPPVRFS
jgi:hypothetical protein